MRFGYSYPPILFKASYTFLSVDLAFSEFKDKAREISDKIQ